MSSDSHNLPTSSSNAADSASDRHTQPAQTTSTATATAAHPPPGKPDPTITTSTNTTSTTAHNGSQRGHPATASSSTELARHKIDLRNGLRQFPDFPSPGILFEDIMPLFASPALHNSLVRALELQITEVFGPGSETTVGASDNSGRSAVDVVVGLESRGFLFGPTLALRLGAAFVPVRKKGKLPGPCITESFQKEYGADHFQMQADAVRPGQKVVIMDDIIATGGSAAAAGKLVRQLGGDLLGYVFLMELDFLKGRAQLDAPVYTLLSGQEEGLKTEA